MKIGFSAAAALFAFCTLSAAASAPAPALYGKLPPIGDISLSGDGSQAVVLRAIQGTYHVTVMDMNTGQSALIMSSNPEEFSFNWCRFANETRIVCSIRAYVTRKSGDANRRYRDGRTIMTRLLAVNADGSDQIQLVPKAVSDIGQDLVWNAERQDDVLSWLPDRPEFILMQIAREDPRHPTVYRLDIYKNKLKRVRKFHPNVDQWIADRAGNIRIGMKLSRTGRLAGHVVDGRKLKPLSLGHLIGAGGLQFLGFAEDDQSAWVSANNGADTRGIHRVAFNDATVVETLESDPDHDIDNLLVHPRTRKPIAATYWKARSETRWYDAQWQAVFDNLQRALPGQPETIRLVSTDHSGNRLVLYTEGNGTPPAFYLFDRRASNLVPLATWYEDTGTIARPRPVSYRARDGLDIPAYLTTPEHDGPHPMVLMPHGGPWARDTPRHDYWVQMLVSRGYAVLQPNFRGSAGYGDRFMSAGFEQWGLKMQDDLIDGLDWAIGAGHADQDRVCIVGGSYGGYAALVAAYKTPERFRCAVSFAGVSSLDELAKRWFSRSFGHLAVARVQTGASRDENSPLLHADKFGIPVLLVHGDVDRRVPVEHSRMLAEALEAAGKEFTYIEQPNSNHHLSLEAHRVQFLEAMDAFLARHLARR